MPLAAVPVSLQPAMLLANGPPAARPRSSAAVAAPLHAVQWPHHARIQMLPPLHAARRPTCPSDVAICQIAPYWLPPGYSVPHPGPSRFETRAALRNRQTVVCPFLSARQPIRRRPTKIQRSQRAPAAELALAPSPVGPREDLLGAIKASQSALPACPVRKSVFDAAACLHTRTHMHPLAQHHPGSLESITNFPFLSPTAATAHRAHLPQIPLFFRPRLLSLCVPVTATCPLTSLARLLNLATAPD